MYTLLLFLLLLTVMALVIGINGYEEIDIMIGVKEWNSLYFQFGIQFVEHTLSDGNIEQQLSLNFFFFNIDIIFYKIRA